MENASKKKKTSGCKLDEQHFPRSDFVVKNSFEDLIGLLFQSSECIVAAIDHLVDPTRSH